MDNQAKTDLERLETLREQALFAPEEQREEAQRAYEELREKLFSNEVCQPRDQAQQKDPADSSP
jgi:hypothetical protein